MPSPNPRGRPRAGLAAVEKVRERVDPDDWVTFTLSIANDEKKPSGERLQAWLALIDRGYLKPPQSLELNVNRGDEHHDLSAATDAELQRLHELESEREQILATVDARSAPEALPSGPPALEQESQEPLVSDDNPTTSHRVVST